MRTVIVLCTAAALNEFSSNSRMDSVAFAALVTALVIAAVADIAGAK